MGVGRARRQAVAGSMARSTRRDDERGVNVGRADDGELGGALGGSGDDGGTMGNGLTTATVNHSSFPMALAFGIVFGGGLFAIRRKVSLSLMVVVVGKKTDKALMQNQNVSFLSLP